MKAFLAIISLGALALSGCVVPVTQFNEIQAQNRALTEQSRAQLAEIQNLREHGRTLEDRVIRSEKQVALLQERSSLDQKQLDEFRRERENLYSQFKGMAFGRGRLPAELSQQFAELSRRYPGLQFDSETGVSKLDSDILFDSGEAELKPGAERLLDDLVRVLKSPAAADLKIMIAGHTDNQAIAGRDVREKYPDNFHLSTARALAVAKKMKQSGLSEHRLGVAGFGAYQPVVANTTAQDRQKNRRVEIFVMAPEVPVIGWAESTPSVYGSAPRR